MEYIKKIKNKNWVHLINENVDFLENMQFYGEYIIGLINEKQSSQVPSNKEQYFHENIIKLLLVESLQVLDGIISLFKEHSIDISVDLIRHLLELTVYIKYILDDDSLVEKKAIAYHINSINTKIKHYEKKYTESNDPKYLIAKNNLLDIFSNYAIYSEVNNEWEHKNSEKKKKQKTKWYFVHGGGNNFRALCDKLNLSEYYETYIINSNKIHGANSIDDGIYVNINNESYIKNPKIPVYAYSIIGSIYALISLTYYYIIKYFLENSDLENFNTWNTNINIERINLQYMWKSFENDTIKNGNLY